MSGATRTLPRVGDTSSRTWSLFPDAGEVRAEDAFDIDALVTWLRAAVPDESLSGFPVIRQFSGGLSNLTYLLSFPHSDLVLRRPPRVWRARGAHDVAREYRIQAELGPILGYVPDMVALCEDSGVIGTPFYVMHRVPGLVFRRDLPAEWDITPDELALLCGDVVDLLADLHTVDPGEANLSWLSRGPGYVARQVSGWSERYRRVRTRNVASFESVIAWLIDNQPSDRGVAMVHNAFRFDNIVFDSIALDRGSPIKPVALLDWEMATVGDPLMDLGSALAYWVECDDGPLDKFLRRQPTHAAGMLTRDEVVEHYCRRRGIGLDDHEWAFYRVFGLFRLAVICQQIFRRYHRKQAPTATIRLFGIAVVLLERRCRTIIRRSR
ncbi:phosphotransferase family protein [Nocardia sp. BSTN01]|uniref:phosphotransferase family protein n=1 Tax=Nocardia sp. BSTN01 TaxID=2783665 RepID=UPI001890385F|nr:phosphotransferase family protein [Nocardia sp. BSTN01]MBF4997413.1 phosphotransferase family protein [Nocardia sp. BSTN01]